jgi:DNA-binding transcriptional regulator LsrR (DeoR family)
MLVYISITRVKISKEEQIKLRRDAVFELRAQGLTQQEIANKLSAFGVSRRTIGNDLEYLRKNALSIMRAHQGNIAFEYQQILSNFYQLRKHAWARFNDPRTNNHDRMTLYRILENLNHDILDALAVGDMIEHEALESMKEDVQSMQKAMDEMKIMEPNENGKNEQAIF